MKAILLAASLVFTPLCVVAQGSYTPAGWSWAPNGVDGGGVYTSADGTMALSIETPLPARSDVEAVLNTVLKGDTPKSAPTRRDIAGGSVITVPMERSLGAPGRGHMLIISAKPGQDVQVMRFYSVNGKPPSQQTMASLMELSATANARAKVAKTEPALEMTRDAKGISGVVHDFGKKRYNAVSGLWKFGEEAIYVLYNDGWAQINPDAPLSTQEAAKARAAGVGTWVKASEVDALRNRSKLMRPAKAGTRYSLELNRPSSSGTMGLSIASRYGFKLTRDGRFEIDEYHSASGGWESGEKTAESKGKLTGRYTVEGVTIRLDYDNGRTETLLFATNGRDKAVVGDRYYFKTD